MTTVIIVDDQNSIREFLKINLSTETDIEVVGMADNGQSAIAQVEEHQPSMVLMDIEMPGKLDGIEATEEIVKRFPQIKVLLFTSQNSKQQLNRALKAGARGYVLKNTSIKDLSNIIRLTEKDFFQIGPMSGNWDGSTASKPNSDTTIIQTRSAPNQVPALIREGSEYAYANSGNKVVLDLTSGVFQFQETIKYQDDTVVNLTNQYSQVQQEIPTKLESDRHRSQKRRVRSYNSRITPRKMSLGKQNLLFIVSFFLGVVTVTFLFFLLKVLGSFL